MIFPLLCLAIFLVCGKAHGDIYRYLDDEGVVCFTDTPNSKKAVKVLREAAPSRGRQVRNSTPFSSRPRMDAQKLSESGNPGKHDTYCDPDAVLPVSGRISSGVGLRHDPIDGLLREHKGVDIAVPEGTPVRPVAPGVVIFSGYRSGYGNTVMIRHEDGMITLYAHNSTNLKNEGEPVDRGSTIAFSGSTGRSTGPHLHFEAWRNGVNITSVYVPGAGPSYAAARPNDGIRRTVQADGTLVFSNLP